MKISLVLLAGSALALSLSAAALAQSLKTPTNRKPRVVILVAVE